MLTLKAPTFSNDALVGLYRALAAVRNHTATPNSAFGVSLARNAMRAHVEAVEDVMKLPEIADEFKVYEDARNKLLCEFANKDAAGEPVMVPINDKMSRFDVAADKQAAMTAALAVLNEANADLRARYADKA